MKNEIKLCRMKKEYHLRLMHTVSAMLCIIFRIAFFTSEGLTAVNPNVHIILISGKQGSGKDTLALNLLQMSY